MRSPPQGAFSFYLERLKMSKTTRHGEQMFLAVAILISIAGLILLIIIADSLPSIVIGVLGLVAWVGLILMIVLGAESKNSKKPELKLVEDYDHESARAYAKADIERTLTIFDSRNEDSK